MRTVLASIFTLAFMLAPPRLWAGDAPPPQATPFFMSGGGLMEACEQAAKDEVAQVACVLYVVGIVDAYNLNPATRFCIPLSATRTDLATVVWQWMKDHPEHNGSPAASVIILAMQTAYPCPKAAPAPVPIPPAPKN